MIHRVYRYRLYPSQAQDAALHALVEEACRLYNAALDERRSAWRTRGLGLTYFDQASQLKEIRAAGNVMIANFTVCQEVLRRVDRTFAAFVRRLRAGQKPGYPRFRSGLRYDSVTWPKWGNGCALRTTGRLYLHGVGDVKVKWHRSLPEEAVIKTTTVKRQAGKWYVCFCLEMSDAEPLPESPIAVGIDLGLTAFLVTSAGDVISNPRHFRAAERSLRRAHRKLARRQKRSRRRQKARRELARLNAHVACQRRDFHHKTAHALVRDHGLIAVENLNVKGLAGSMLAKSVHDAGWSQFLHLLAVKAEEAGRLLVAVNPAGTTQRCSSCGQHVRKTLSCRWHDCPVCGFRLGRDENAARNILQLAQRPGWGLQAQTVGHSRAVA